MGSYLTAYLQSVQLKHQQEQLENERKNAEAMVKLHQKQLDQTAQQHASDLKLRTAIAKQEMANHFQGLYGNTASTPPEISGLPTGDSGGEASGVTNNPQDPVSFQAPQQQITGNYNPNPQAPYQMTESQGWTPEMQQLFGPMMIDPQFQSKQLAAQKPVLDALAVQQQRLEDIKNKGKIDVAHAAAGDRYDQAIDQMNARMEGMKDIQGLKNQGAYDTQGLRNELGMYKAQMQLTGMIARMLNTQSGNTPEEGEFYGPQVASGQYDYKSVPSKSKPATDTWMQAHGYVIPKDQKGLGDAIATAHTLFDDGGFMDQAMDAINKYSANGLPATIGHGIQTAVGMGPVQGALDNLRAQAGPARKFFDQNNRSSESEALRTIQGIFDPKLNTEQNKENYYKHMNSMTDAIMGKISGMPESQQYHILMSQGLAGLGYPEETDDNGKKYWQIMPIFKTDPSGNLRKYNPKKKGYARVKD